jgi:hypothetical protein
VNGGRPFYVVVRTVEPAAFTTESYDVVAEKVFATPADPSVVRTEIVYPGTGADFEVPKPEAKPLAVYFLFTSPGGNWKLIRRPPVPSDIEVELEKNRIKEGVE